MKKTLIIFGTIITCIVSFIIYVNLSGAYINLHKLQVKESKILIMHLKNADAKSIKEMFCTSTIDNCENIDKQIDVLIQNIGKNIEETGEIVGGGESQHSQNGKITRLDYNATIKDVVLKNGQKCDITFLSDPINDDYPDYKGIELIGVHFEDSSKDFYVGK